MRFNCECGFATDDESIFLAHLIECDTTPEEKWSSYAEGQLAFPDQPFLNSEILEEEKKDGEEAL